MKTTTHHLEALAGTTLADKYRLLRLLGSGGMGYVYQAEQLDLGRSVAVKLLRPELSSNAVQRFRNEAKSASRINHPHAVAVYDFGVTDEEVPFLVMEHLRGQTLASLIEAQPLSPQRIVALTAQVLSALAEAHACGVVHCDLTSDNVIVERLRDGDDFAKVIDFGLARAFDAVQPGSRIVGTPEYMAPEQIRGEPVTPATDLYAVGVLLYEMIVGRTPFAGAAVPAVLEGHLELTPSAPHEVIPTCPPTLGEVVLWALEKSPQARPPSAREMREHLLAATGVQRPAAQPAPVKRRAPVPLAAGSRSLTREVALTTRRSTRLTCELSAAAHVLIGRDVELARVTAFCRGALPGSSMAIIGPRGIGKARLVLEASRAAARSAAVFIAAADPSGLCTPWYPILTLLEAVLDLPSPPTIETLTAAVARCGLPDRDVPGLAEVFGIAERPRDLELAVRRREAHAATLRTLLSIQRRFPRAVLAFADVDEFDQPSRKLLRSLAEAADGSAIALIVTSSSDAQAPPTSSVLQLEPLSPQDARDLAAALVGPEKQLPTALAVHSITGGSPSAVEQLAGWISMGNSPSTAPSLLVDLVSLRINRLPSRTRRLLQAVAIHGTVAPRWVVEACVEGASDELESRDWTGLLVVDASELTIPSELVADVAGACTPADVRRQLHRRAGEILAGHAPVGVLGHHAEHGGELRHAYSLYIEAGDDAVRRFDDAGATSWYRRALELARQLAHEPQGTPRLIDALLRLADLLRIGGQTAAVVELLDEAARLQQSDAQRATAARIRGGVHLTGGDGRRAIEELEHAVGIAMRLGDREFLCTAYLDLAAAMDRVGRTAAATEELAEAIDVITMGEGLRSRSAPRLSWYLGLRLAERYVRGGRLEDARRLAHDALEAAKRADSSRGLGRLSALLGQIYEELGDPTRALRHRSSAIDQMNALGDRRSTAELLIHSAQSTRRRPDTEPAVRVQESEDGMRLASKLAAEIGWREGISLSLEPDSD